jgi:hypothetical protein
MQDKFWFWGYLHSNGKPQLKRWFGDHEDYTGDCIGNPFVLKIVKPFQAESYTEALEILEKKIKGR